MTRQIKTPNFEILCCALSDDVEGIATKAERLIRKSAVDWNKLCIAAEIHAVRPQLCALLRKLTPGLVPKEIVEGLHCAVKENLYQQLRLLAEYFSIHNMLGEAGILAVPFKGFALANHFYKNLSERESADVDLFIHKKDLAKTRELMFSRGYTPEPPLQELTDQYILTELCEYNFDYYDGAKRMFHFEMHWRPGLTALGMDIDLAALEGEISSQTLQHQQVDTFSPSAQLLLTILHHGGKDQFSQLKQILDISRALKRQEEIDWGWLHGVLATYNAERLLYVGVKVASILTHVVIPRELLANTNSREIQNLAINRINRLEARGGWQDVNDSAINELLFRLSTRTNFYLRWTFITAEIRKKITTQLIPRKLRHYFFNKNIRRTSQNI